MGHGVTEVYLECVIVGICIRAPRIQRRVLRVKVGIEASGWAIENSIPITVLQTQVPDPDQVKDEQSCGLV